MDKKKIFLVSLGHLSCDVNGGAVPALLPFLIAAYHFDYQAAAGLMFALSCFGSIIQPLFGYLSDKISKPWFIPLGVLVAGLGVASIGLLRNYWAIFAVIAVSGIGAAIFHPEAARYANKVSGERKGLGLSLFSVGGNGGYVVGPLLVVALVGGFDLGGPFVFHGFGLRGTLVFGGVAVVMAAILLGQIAHMDRLPGAGVRSGPSLSGGAGEARNDWHAFSRLTGTIIVRSILFLGFNTFIPLYWTHVFSQSEAAGGFALTCFGTFGVISNFIGGFLSDRFGYVRIIRLSYLLLIPVVVAFACVTDSRVAFALLLPLGFALYAPFSSMVVLGQKYLARNIGFASGVTLGLAISVGGVTAPLLGRVADAWGLPGAIWCMAAVAVAGTVFAFLLSTAPGKAIRK